MGYRFLGHTADMIIEGTGPTLVEAIEQAAEGLMERMGRAEKEEASFEIEEKAENLDELVVHALSSVITECEIRELQPFSFKLLKLDSKGRPKALKARVGAGPGTAYDTVKAITYHELTVQDKKGKAVVRVLLDI